MGLILEGSQPLLPAASGGTVASTDITDSTAVGRDVLTAANAAAARTAIGVTAGTTHTSGTLAARPAVPAAGDSYAVTSGVAAGDRYACLVAGAWTLVAYAREYGDDTPSMLWRLDETSSTYASQGTHSVPLTVTGALNREAVGYDGLTCPRLPGTAGVYAASASAIAGVGLGISNAPTALTLAAWVRPESVTGLRSILVCQYNSANSNPYYCGLALSTGEIRALVVKAGAYQELKSGSAAHAAAGVLQHVGWTYNEGSDLKVRFYVNGSLVATSAATTGAAALDLGTTSRWAVGDLPGSATEYFAGQISSARVYDTAQPLSWWQDVYRRGAGVYRGA